MESGGVNEGGNGVGLVLSGWVFKDRYMGVHYTIIPTFVYVRNFHNNMF